MTKTIKNNRLKIIVSGIYLSIVMFQGCSLTPYHDDYACNKGAGQGKCDSVSNIYKSSYNDSKGNNAKGKQKCLIQIDDCFEKHKPSRVLSTGEIDKVKKCVFEVIENECKIKETHIEDSTKKKIEDILFYQHLRNEQLNQKLSDSKSKEK